MEGETIPGLMLLSGVALGVAKGTATEAMSTKVGFYKPKTYPTEWRARW